MAATKIDLSNRMQNAKLPSIKKWLLLIILCFFSYQSCFSTPAKKHDHIVKKNHSKITHSKTKLHSISHVKKISSHRGVVKIKKNHFSNTSKKKKVIKQKISKQSVVINKKKQVMLKKPIHRSTTSPEHTALMHANDTLHPNLPAYLLSNSEKRLVKFVHQTISTLNYSCYKLGGTQIDIKRGIFIVDCSTYVDHIMKTVYPNSYSNLVSWSGSQKPTTNDYYQYFTNLEENDKLRFWNNIDNVDQLRPGDILVFRYKNNHGRQAGGHVMIVMDKPVRDGDAFLVRVADSAAVGHSKDTRLPNRSGIGIGTLLLKTANKTAQPTAYAWKVGSRWEYDVKIAMARPTDITPIQSS